MGLLTILKKVKEEEREIRILVLGLDNAGKTTIVRRLCDKPIDSIEPTLGFSIQTLEYDLRDDDCDCDCEDDDGSPSGASTSSSSKSKLQLPMTSTSTSITSTFTSPSPSPSSSTTYQLHLWDIGGQSTIRAYWRNYFEKTDGIIWVVDSGDRRRMQLVKTELDTVLEQERLAGASLLVLANKSDLKGALGKEAIARALQLGRTIETELETELELETKTTNNNGGGGEPTTTTKPSGREPTDSSQMSSHSSRHWTIRASSAVTGEGLAESIEWLVRDITDRIYFAA